MRQAGLFGCGGRKRKARTTIRSQAERTPPAPDLVKRNFTPEAPDRLWVSDITYVRTWEGWLYLSFVLDTYSRRVVGWSMSNNLRTELVLDAVNMAIYTRRPSPGLIHHSDRGSQYTSVEFGTRLREEGLLPSMGSVADAYDDSMAESFVSTLKRELIHRPLVAEPSDSQDGDLRVHRGLLQHQTQALRPGASESFGIRGG